MMTPNPFNLAKWIFDKFWYWLGWSSIFLGLMFVLTSVGNSRELFIAYSFGSFWIATAFMDWMRERWKGKPVEKLIKRLDKLTSQARQFPTRNHRKGAEHRGI